MNDLISRQAAIDAIRKDMYADKDYMSAIICEGIENVLNNLPSAEPELPKQFMSDDCISRSELYKKVCEAEKLARERVLDTPSDSPFPNKLNPAYTRYSAQLNERTQFKHMIADARSVQPEQRWIPCSERLPEADERVLVTTGSYDYYVWDCMSNRSDNYFWEDESGFYHDKHEVIAWMPLPPSYKEGQND